MAGMTSIILNGSPAETKEFKRALKVSNSLRIGVETLQISMKPKQGYKKCSVVFQGRKVETKFIYVKRGRV